MKALLIPFILACLLFTACKPAVYMINGVRQAKPETPESLLRYIKKHDGPVRGQYMFRDSAAWAEFLGDSVFWHNMIGTMIFDKDLALVLRDTSKCIWSGSTQIKNIVNDSAIILYDKFSGEKLLKSLVPLWDTATYHLPERGDFDFLVINSWAKFVGKFSERLFITGKYGESVTKPRFRVIYLNIDMQKSWNLKEDQQFKLVFE
jgi:hypothetical protein